MGTIFSQLNFVNFQTKRAFPSSDAFLSGLEQKRFFDDECFGIFAQNDNYLTKMALKYFERLKS